MPEMSLAMSSSLDRIEWRGEANLVIVGTTRPSRMGAGKMFGFATDGRTVDVPLLWRAPFGVISLTPSSLSHAPSFAWNPSKTQKQDRSTISTLALEFGAASDVECAPNAKDCGGYSGGGTSGPDVEVGVCGAVFLDANASNDLDADGIVDYCEAVFANAFEPELWIDAEDWYTSRREPYYVVKLASGWLQIGYLLSYYVDPAPWTHVGDSEFIILEIRRKTTSTMAVRTVTLSAHWGACCWSDQTRTLTAPNFQFFEGRPIVWVSRDHHANYESEYACDETFNDVCGAGSRERVGISVFNSVAGANLGQGGHPFDIDPGNPLGLGCTRNKREPATRVGIECYLEMPYSAEYGGDDAVVNRFAGWSNSWSTGATHYKTVLQAWGLW